jgi:hypothetical protein
MAAVSKQNIKSTFCPCVLVQGVKCPAGRRGKVCTRAHTTDEIQPKPCTREKEGEGCFCKDKPWPLVCVFIHDGESVKDDYPKRLGFDPEHKAFDNKTWSELNSLADECYKHKKYFQDSLGWYEKNYGDDIPEEDLDYVKQTRFVVYLLKKKEEFVAQKFFEAQEAEFARLEAEGAYDEPHKDDNGDRFFRTPEEKAKNREKVRAKFKKGKYVRVHEVFEDENDEECYEEYREMMEQDYMDDMEGSYADMQLAIVNDWVEGVIERWDNEDKGAKFTNRHLKNAWGDYRDDKHSDDWPLPLVFSSNPSPLQIQNKDCE